MSGFMGAPFPTRELTADEVRAIRVADAEEARLWARGEKCSYRLKQDYRSGLTVGTDGLVQWWRAGQIVEITEAVAAAIDRDVGGIHGIMEPLATQQETNDNEK